MLYTTHCTLQPDRHCYGAAAVWPSLLWPVGIQTSHHIDWTRKAMGNTAIDDAQATGRLRLIDSSGGDVADPFFGGQQDYDLVAAHLLAELPLTLDKVLRERGLLGLGDASLCVSSTSCCKETQQAAVGRGRELARLQGTSFAPDAPNIPAYAPLANPLQADRC